MAQNHQANNPLFKALEKKYIADIASANATMIIYFDNSVAEAISAIYFFSSALYSGLSV